MVTEESLQQIIDDYDEVVRNIDRIATETAKQPNKSYGGAVRVAKGALLERIAETLAVLAWNQAGGNPDSIEINSKKIPIPIRSEYIARIEDKSVQNYIRNNISDYVYKLSVDKHVYIDGNFVIAIECKSYSENAMMKRILVDFDFLKKAHPDLSCYLIQFESQLGGDYSDLANPTFGSHPTHTIQSYFSCDLNIITLVQVKGTLIGRFINTTNRSRSRRCEMQLIF